MKLRTADEFFPYFGKKIIFDDERSITMPIFNVKGMVVGILLGTAILPLLRSFVIFAGIPSDLEFTVIGLALLLGTVADEIVRRQTGTRLFERIAGLFIKPKSSAN